MSEQPSVYATARQGVLVRLANPLAARARRRRHDLFRMAMGPAPDDRVIDIGCGPIGLAAFEPHLAITGVDRVNRPDYRGPNRAFIQADARALPFDDASFDVAYSNSLIEHLEPADRPRFAAEVTRVAKRYFVQTPNRWFPVEPHVLLPLYQFLPRGARERLWRFGVSRNPFEDIRLLDAHELAHLFPDAVILRERVGPLTKSLIAAGPKDQISAGNPG
jgi:Methyltransferase domain